ncbi:MAG: ferric reductase-like transmembrane domain-containing protein [Opitutales bacterium]
MLRSRWLIHAVLTAPAVGMAVALVLGRLGVDPLDRLIDLTGLTAAVLLVVVLSLTPLARGFRGQGWIADLNRHRRAFGVSAFWYASGHLLAHLLYEGGLAWLTDSLDKPFIVAGLVAWTILLVLSVTSLQVWVKRLGGRRWKSLHRLAYVAAALVAYHLAVAGKGNPGLALGLFGSLLIIQTLRWVPRRSS